MPRPVTPSIERGQVPSLISPARPGAGPIPFPGYGSGIATIDDAARMARDLPEVTEGERYGNLTWFVRGKGFAWERPFSKADIKRFGDGSPPEGPIFAVRVADLVEKEAVLAASSESFFTIPHFDRYAAVLIQLDTVGQAALQDAIADAWLACAPSKLADEYLRDVGSGPTGNTLR